MTWHVLPVSSEKDNIDGLVQNCSNSTANALELLQSCTKQSIWCLNADTQSFYSLNRKKSHHKIFSFQSRDMWV